MENTPYDTSNKRRIALIAVAAVIIAAGAFALINGNARKSAGKPFNPADYIQSEPTLPPVSKLTTVIDKETEYRPSTNPKVQDAYCKNYYAKNVYTYQYLGQTDVENPTVECS